MRHLILFCLLLTSVLAQVGSWSRLPIATEIREMDLIDNELVLATDGGVLHFDPVFREYTEEGFLAQSINLDVNTIHRDTQGRLWLGCRAPGDVLIVADPVSGERLTLDQIDVDEVVAIAETPDAIWAAYRQGVTGGLLLYRNQADDVQYLDIFENFPQSTTLSLNQINSLQILNGQLIFTVPEAVLWAPLNASNLKDPAVWSARFSPEPLVNITTAGCDGETLVLGVGDALYGFNFTSFELIADAAATGGTIRRMRKMGSSSDTLLFVSTTGVGYLHQGTIFNFQPASIPTDVSLVPDGNDTVLWVASETDFMQVLEPDATAGFRPNMPVDRVFTELVVLENGDLIGGTSQGFGIWSAEGWWNLIHGRETRRHDPALREFSGFEADTLDLFREQYIDNGPVEDMLLDSQGRIWASIQGRGVVRFDPAEGYTYTTFDTSAAILEPTFDSQHYILATQLAEDPAGGIWVTQKYVRVGRPVLSLITPADEAFHIAHSTSGIDSRLLRAVAVDDQNRIWTGAQVETELQSNGGLYVIQYDGDPNNLAQAEIASLNGDPLESNDILQLEIDNQNQLWILTTSGVQSMPLPATWLSTSELRDYARIYMTQESYWQLADYQITSMEIDRRGNRWFLSSNAGIHILQSNGVWMNGGYGYHTGNSAILDDQIHSAAFDRRDGIAYLSTQKGLSLLKTPFADPRSDYQTIFIYPQPFDPERHGQVYIQGLMDNSNVKILTMNGRLVRELTARSGEVEGFEAHWDGRDGDGDLVGNGVFILLLTNEDGNATSQKLAVLR